MKTFRKYLESNNNIKWKRNQGKIMGIVEQHVNGIDIN